MALLVVKFILIWIFNLDVKYKVSIKKRGKILKKIALKLGKLVLGILLCASSTVFMLNSNIGLLPWDVFHQGISKLTGIDIGLTSIIVSFIVMIFSILLGEKVGFGSIVNIILGGIFIDFLNNSNIIPKAHNLITGLVMILIGMMVMGYGCYLYMSCGLGCGPRDSTMIGLSKKLNKSVKWIKAIMEVTVLVIGILLGGKFGIGTVITAVCIGIFIELSFKLSKVDAKNIEQKSLKESFIEVLEIVRIV